MSNFLNLFKIACINYTPNPVSYQDKAINRQELVSLQKVVSDLAIEGIEATETFINQEHKNPEQTRIDY